MIYSDLAVMLKTARFTKLHIEDQDLPAKSGHLDWRASLNFDSLEATVRNLSQQ